MMEKKKYQTPYAEALRIEADEILTTSPESADDTAIDDFGNPL